MKKKDLKKLAKDIAHLELELKKETSEARKEQIEREIMFKSENSELELSDYFELDELIQSIIEKESNK